MHSQRDGSSPCIHCLFVADVQGPKVIHARSIKRNRSMAGSNKVFSIAQALAAQGHKITIYSPASVAERTGHFFSSLSEVLDAKKFPITVFYGATVDNRLLRDGVAMLSAARWLPEIIHRHSVDTVCIYNITTLTMFGALVARAMGAKVIMEYEDSALAARASKPPLWKKFYRVHELVLRAILHGAFAPSQKLLEDLGVSNSLWLPGAVSGDLIAASKRPRQVSLTTGAPLRLIYAGGLDESKGIDRFLLAMEQIAAPLDIHICGNGPLEQRIEELCRTSRHQATFHGLVSRAELLDEMTTADVGINAHRADFHEGGSWPFKVVEYLAACGTVFCNDTNRIDKELRARLFLYHADTVEGIADSFKAFMAQWSMLAPKAEERRSWAIDNYGPVALAKKIEELLS